jgi:outer membrane protein
MKLAKVFKVTTVSVLLAVASPGFATTLTDALIQAYQTNPALRVGRSGLRATDEAVRQAKGTIAPTITGNLSVDRNGTRNPGSFTQSDSASISMQIPIYAGGTGILGIEQSRYNVLAGRQSLIATEQSVLLNAVTAYMDVRRDQRNVEIAKNSVRVLTEEVRAARERFEVGEVTRTDVAQAESRLAASQSILQTNRAAQKRSIDAYIATIGSKPVNLRTPPATPKLPKSARAAETIAVAKHPSILQQQFIVSAAETAVEIAKRNKLPVASANITAQRGTNLTLNKLQNSGSVGLDINQTIYQGGRLNSLQRQALARLEQEQANLQLAGVQVRQNVNSTYATWIASKASIQARQKQVRAAQIAFDGASEEAKLGARTTLDVLNSEQDLLQARSDLLTAIRDEYVNAYGVLSAMGLLTVDHLNLGIPSYNPDVNYTSVNGTKKFGAKRQKLFDRLKKLSGN